MISGDLKRMLSAQGNDIGRLYDIGRDPGETLNLAAGHGEVARRMRRDLRQWLRAQREIRRDVRRGRLSYNAELSRQLRSLGYIQ